MKVAIGVPCRGEGRFSMFWECLGRMKRPANTPDPYIRYNNSVAQARNQIVEAGLADGCDTFFFLDDDMLFKPDVLMKMLERTEDIVIGLTLLRYTQDGSFYPIWSQKRLAPFTAVPGKWAWESVPAIVRSPNGLMPLVSGTAGGVLIQGHVFKAMQAPYWQMGQYDPEMFWEDIHFYEAALDRGFKVWGHPDVRFGHCDSVVLWPNERPDGTWSTVVAHGFKGFLEQPWTVSELV